MRFLLLIAMSFVCVGCNVTYHRGLKFDFRGETAARSASGGVANVKVVQVDNRFGAVNVEPGVNGDYRWSWNLKVWSNSQQEAELWLDEIRLDVAETGGVASWTLVLPEDAEALRGVKSDLTLHIPSTAQVRVTNRGDVDIAGVEGPVEVRNEHGDIKLADLVSLASIRNEHGDVVAERLASIHLNAEHGKTRLTDIAGDLTIQAEHAALHIAHVAGFVRCKGEHESLTVENVTGLVDVDYDHGDVILRGIQGNVRTRSEHGRLEVDTMADEVECRHEHGDVKLVLQNPELQRLKVKSEHSDIHIVVPSSFEGVSLKSEHGQIASEVPVVRTDSRTVAAEHGDIRIEVQ